jgi:hypothetical protein
MSPSTGTTANSRKYLADSDRYFLEFRGVGA